MNENKILPLNHVLQYKNDDIIDRFLGKYSIPEIVAINIFMETKKWLWLLAVAKKERENGFYVPRLVIDDFLIFIDEMWHNFILFTHEYTEFCQEYFGFYIHHNPTPPRVKKIIQTRLNNLTGFEEMIEKRREQYSYIYDKLGATTLQLWYSDWSHLYTPEYFLTRDKRLIYL